MIEPMDAATLPPAHSTPQPEPDHAARAAELAAENQRLRVEMELSRALGGRISGQAAHDAARLLALDARINEQTGELYHPKLGIGANEIVSSYLSGPGSYLLQTGAAGGQPARGNGQAATGWDIERAKKDSEYMAAWRRADEKGFQAAWKNMMDQMLRNLRTRGA